MNSYSTIAQNAVREVGRNVRYLFNQVTRFSPEQRNDDGPFRESFSTLEKQLAKEILALYPNHSIQGAYMEPIDNEARHQWYVSAVSGEENFRMGEPHFSMTLAYEMDGKLNCAVIFNPMNDELYAASRNDGATYNDLRIRSEKAPTKLSEMTLLTDLCRDEDYEALFIRLNREARAIRIHGDLGLDIGAVARGIYQGYFALDYSRYSAKAAVLIAQEAGFLVTDFKGAENRGDKDSILVVHPRMLRHLLNEMR